MKGKVKFFNTMKGFGFIAGDDGKEYFVHQTGLKPGVTLKENDEVSFDVTQGDRGPKAENVSLGAGEEKSEEAEKPSEESEESSEEPEEKEE